MWRRLGASRSRRERAPVRSVDRPLRVESLEDRQLLACSATTLCAAEVEQLLDRASAATPSDGAIIAIVDRAGHILGVRVEAGVVGAGPNQIATGDVATLVFAIDGAIAKARTAAFFANDQAPLTSRTVQFISQTTITQREVDSNPNVDPVLDADLRGPGFVAPIGIAGHFPPRVKFTPQVDLFAIEHTNRDSICHPGPDHIRDGCAAGSDDISLSGRFNIDPSFVPAGQEIDAPESYGFVSGLLANAQSRGIATLPGGIPIFKDAAGGTVNPPDPLVGGIGVFFPGPDGFASYEQDFGGPNAGVNAPLVLEAEFIAAAAVEGRLSGSLGGVAPVPGIGVANVRGRIDLVGITLDTVGPRGAQGLKKLTRFGKRLGPGVVNGSDQTLGGVVTLADGEPVPDGWLVTPHAGGGLSSADVNDIIEAGIAEAERVRAAIRLPLSRTTRMVFSVTDVDGNVLGLYRMPDATFFSIDVATAKARNVAYYADPTPGVLQAADQVDANDDGNADLPTGVAFTNRTIRFLALPHFPEGIDRANAGDFSILNDAPGCVNLQTAATTCASIPAGAFTSVVGFDAFNPGTNFRDPGNVANQNGIVFFPGSVPIYKAGVLVGGFGVSGDGVDQDDVVTAAGAAGFMPPEPIRADHFQVRQIRLPFIKFLRNPHGL
jgi:uncharacterized protein GlcG (DUF336 family)